MLGSYAGSPGPTSEYSIDDGTPISFTGPINGTVELYQQIFYQSPTLTDGEHTITWKLVKGDWFWFDELTYVPSSASSKPKTPIGPIVGGVIAGLIVVVALVFLALFWRKRRRARHMYSPGVFRHRFPSVTFKFLTLDQQPYKPKLRTFTKSLYPSACTPRIHNHFTIAPFHNASRVWACRLYPPPPRPHRRFPK